MNLLLSVVRLILVEYYTFELGIVVFHRLCHRYIVCLDAFMCMYFFYVFVHFYSSSVKMLSLLSTADYLSSLS